MSGAAGVLLAGVVLLAGSAAGVLAFADQPGGSAVGSTREFHRFVGGIGFGPAVDPAGCEFAFDPRVCPSCPHESGPVPGGGVFCPHHGCSILEYPAVP